MTFHSNQNNIKSVLKNIIYVAVSNFSNLISGIIIAFIIPKIISIEGYGYYKTFTLYSSYVGLFSLGIIDGIVLKFGGCNYEKFNKAYFRSYFTWYLIINSFWGVILLFIALYNFNNEYGFLLLTIALYMNIVNIIGYFQQISQITLRIKEYTVVKITQSVLNIFSGIFMVFLWLSLKDDISYRVYLIMLIVSSAITMIFYNIIYKEIIFGKHAPLLSTLKKIVILSRRGLPLMLANLSTIMILNIDQLFINIMFANYDYAIYSFSYNLLSLITILTSAISFVIFPILKRMTLNELKNNYNNLVSCILTFVFLAIIIYFPLCEFIHWFLPQYATSLDVFRIILPGIGISTVITVVMHNYYKTLGINIKFFKKSLVVLSTSLIVNILTFIAFKNIYSISIASIVVIIFWYIYVEQYFVIKYQHKRMANILYFGIMAMLFYLISSVNCNWMVSCCVYLISYAIITTILQKHILNTILKTRYSNIF